MIGCLSSLLALVNGRLINDRDCNAGPAAAGGCSTFQLFRKPTEDLNFILVRMVLERGRKSHLMISGQYTTFIYRAIIMASEEFGGFGVRLTL